MLAKAKSLEGKITEVRFERRAEADASLQCFHTDKKEGIQEGKKKKEGKKEFKHKAKETSGQEKVKKKKELEKKKGR